MSKRTLGIVLIFIGAVISLIAATADLIGIGNLVAVGWKQLLLAIVGIYVSLFGFWLIVNKPNSKKIHFLEI
jgi:cytochrome c biogenesis protein CcdA